MSSDREEADNISSSDRGTSSAPQSPTITQTLARSHHAILSCPPTSCQHLLATRLLPRPYLQPANAPGSPGEFVRQGGLSLWQPKGRFIDHRTLVRRRYRRACVALENWSGRALPRCCRANPSASPFPSPNAPASEHMQRHRAAASSRLGTMRPRVVPCLPPGLAPPKKF